MDLLDYLVDNKTTTETNNELSTKLGMSVPTITRKLKRFKDRGYIDIYGSTTNRVINVIDTALINSNHSNQTMDTTLINSNQNDESEIETLINDMIIVDEDTKYNDGAYEEYKKSLQFDPSDWQGSEELKAMVRELEWSLEKGLLPSSEEINKGSKMNPVQYEQHYKKIKDQYNRIK
jgi:DNA-binding Lrp family transcriptional regulator